MPWHSVPYSNLIADRNLQTGNNSLLDLTWIYKHRPLLTMDVAIRREIPLYQRFLKHDTLDDYWKRITFYPDDYRKLDLPALTITGWFDRVQAGAMAYWDGMVKDSAAKDEQFLLVGPWAHVQSAAGGALKLKRWNSSRIPSMT